MNLEIEQNLYENLTEIYIISENAVEVVTQNNRIFRITACETLRGPNNFSARYDELVRGKFDVENEPADEHLVWIKAHEMPWQDGNSIEECIRGALGRANERGA